MDFTISLAHFCEIHGPTSIICTQASTSPCGSCNPCATPPSEDPQTAYACDALYASQPPASLNLNLHANLPRPLTSPLATPPTSPRSPTNNSYFPTFPPSSSSSASFAHPRRPSSSIDSDGETCENCQMVVPKKYSDKIPSGAPGSPSKDGRGRNGSPVLRTCKTFPVRRLPCSPDDGSSTDSSSDLSDTEPSTSFPSAKSSLDPDSAPASPFLLSSRDMHTHTLNYISTSQPQSPTTYSLLRRTCIRALSTEVLPSSKSSGPMMFGDPAAGNTIAYVFRLPDPRSRGARRTYALIAMTGRNDRRAPKAFVQILEVFERVANRIVAMANNTLEREHSVSQTLARPNTTTAAISSPSPLHPSSSSSSSSMPPSFKWAQKDQSPSSTASSPTRNITPVSSFLSAKRLDPDGFPRLSRDLMKAKSLNEIVGQDTFFVELHTLFCNLLHSLIMQFG
ncbi:hypothetical protein IAQ61_010115 [Plenodomus lingam]|uniref:UDENN FLCN/SMCR8-type domain-containing protein n=1 Tax=Leptosphaeria maculans (strain JN3 / isolate v23.1.3 / race Av1-4-5-6-7-8) TaxID=985895 RepID=E5A2Z8_LEPMJ|nr:hypothetical protein LEMA_P094200.1 [Plenodomus lingam JN3]KAH9861914.1 hypothetical protein IAQ61_010115 [Plenodomus lingam]CBX98011.1 hypothetical protein LEMA_P094200.1 [Plenodomus lingam JN3]